jgi:hypothetical protein
VVHPLPLSPIQLMTVKQFYLAINRERRPLRIDDHNTRRLRSDGGSAAPRAMARIMAASPPKVLASSKGLLDPPLSLPDPRSSFLLFKSLLLGETRGVPLGRLGPAVSARFTFP